MAQNPPIATRVFEHLRKVGRAGLAGMVGVGQTMAETNLFVVFFLAFLDRYLDELKEMKPDDKLKAAGELADLSPDEMQRALNDLEIRGENVEALVVALKDSALESLVKANTRIARWDKQARYRDKVIHELLVEMIADLSKRVLDTEKASAEIRAQIEQTVKCVVEARAIQDKRARIAHFEERYFEQVQRHYGTLDLIGVPQRKAEMSLDACFVPLRFSAPSVERWLMHLSRKSMSQRVLGFAINALDLLGLAADAVVAPLMPSTAWTTMAKKTWAGDLLRSLPAEQIVGSTPRVVIKGSAGSGKTTLLHWIALQCATRNRSRSKGTFDSVPGPIYEPARHRIKYGWGDTIPFLILLRNHVNDSNPLPDTGSWVKETVPAFATEPPEGWLDELLESGRAIVMIDGLDELPQPKRALFWKQIRDTLRAYPSVRLCVTTRPLPKNHAKEDWGLPEGTEEYTLAPLDDADMAVLIGRWYDAMASAKPDRASELKRQADELRAKLVSPGLRAVRELADTPFLCAAICLIYHDNQGVLPGRRHELYQLCCQSLLRHRDEARRIVTDSLYDKLAEPDLFLIHGSLALDMMTAPAASGAAGYRTEADKDDVIKWLGGTIGRIGDKAVREGCAAEGLYANLIERRGLLREPVTGRVDFRHRTLQEFLAADAAFPLGRVNQLLDRALDDQWTNIILLAPGTASAGHGGGEQVIQGLLERAEHCNSTAERHRLLGLAVGCLESVRNRKPETEAKVLKSLETIAPPSNESEAKGFALAGDRAIEFLRYERWRNAPRPEVQTACVQALAYIASDDALRELKNEYAADYSTNVEEALARAVPGNPLEWPGIQRRMPKPTILLQTPLAAKVDTLSPLAEYKGFPCLCLLGCDALCDLDGATSLKELEVVVLSAHRNDRLTSAKPLEHLSLLEELGLFSMEALSELPDFDKLPRLKTVRLRDMPKNVSLPDFSQCSQLNTLHLDNCYSGDWNRIRFPTALSMLALNTSSTFSTLEKLATLRELKRLGLTLCPSLSDLTALRELPALEALVLNRCERITTIETLIPLKDSLKGLELTHCPAVSNLAPLKHLRHLKNLNLSHWHANTDLALLADLTELETLAVVSVAHGRFDLSPLKGLPKLRHISLPRGGQYIGLNRFHGRVHFGDAKSPSDPCWAWRSDLT